MKHIVEVSQEYSSLARTIVKALDDLDACNQCDWVVLVSDEKKKSNRRNIFGDCEKVKDKYRCFVPYDFVVTLYEPNIEYLTDNQILCLIWHELKHIGVEEDGTCYIVPHDFEDFDDIAGRFGIDWNREGKEIESILKEGDLNE